MGRPLTESGRAARLSAPGRFTGRAGFGDQVGSGVGRACLGGIRRPPPSRSGSIYLCADLGRCTQRRTESLGGAAIRLAFTVAVALLFGLLPVARLAAEQPARNVRGIHTLAATSQAITDQLTWASAMVGAGGHVTQPFLGIDAATQAPTSDAVAYVEGAYARQLDPILVLQGRYVNRDGCNASGFVGWLAPIPDEEGGRYRREAAGYARFVAGLPRVDGRTLLIQIANEPNLHEMWGGVSDPAAYARFMVDVASEIRTLGDHRIQVLNAAFAS